MHIGWVGLGDIGTQMVKRALAAGQAVTVYARGKGLAEVQAAGAKTADGYAALAGDCDILGLCVFHDAQIRDVLFDSGGLAAMKPGAIVAVHTTGSPRLAEEIGERAPDGVETLDATFSGGPDQVQEGKLTLMVGGAAQALDRARPLFDSYCNRIHHVGRLGQGQVIKLLNNLLFAANLQNAAEALRIAEQRGFSSREAAAIIQDCSGRSLAMSLFTNAQTLEQRLGAAKHYMTKDVAVAKESAEAAGIDFSPFASTVDYFKPA